MRNKLRLTRISGVLFAVGLLSVGAAQSQTNAHSNSAFAVASVKPGDPHVRQGSLEYIPESGKFQSNTATIDQLISFAYDVRAFQIAGGPGWRGSEGFSITAIAEEAAIPLPSTPAGTQMFRLMLRQLLADRFQLVAREETREAPVYELVVDQNGSKLKQADAATNGNGFVRMAPGQLTGTAVPIFLMVNQLSRQLGQTVIDKTGLVGRYDFSLTWQPEMTSENTEGGPTIFTAIREELGLRLQPAKGPVRFVVIDHLEKPSAN